MPCRWAFPTVSRIGELRAAEPLQDASDALIFGKSAHAIMLCGRGPRPRPA
jgi:hypothetical protein